MSFDDILLNLHNFMGILLWKPCPLFSLAAVVVAFAAAASPAHTRCPTQFQQPHRIQNQVFAPHISNRFETNEQDVSEEVTDQQEGAALNNNINNNGSLQTPPDSQDAAAGWPT